MSSARQTLASSAGTPPTTTVAASALCPGWHRTALRGRSAADHQRLRIPAAPEYPSARSPLAVAHDQTLTFGQELFVGSASSKAPAFIRIEKITAKDGDGTGTALQRDADGDGPGAPTAVSEGDVISAADFGKLSWNTAHNDGGSFRFVALDANRKHSGG